MPPPAMRPVPLQDPLILFPSTLLCSYLRFPKIVGPPATLFRQRKDSAAKALSSGVSLLVKYYIALSLTEYRSLWVDYYRSVAVCCSGSVALGRYLVAVGRLLWDGRCGSVTVGRCETVTVGRWLWVSSWDG